MIFGKSIKTAEKRYFQVTDGTYILMYGISKTMGDTISKTRYNKILKAVQNKPEDTEDTYYRLLLDLTWEANKRPPEPEPDPDPEKKN